MSKSNFIILDEKQIYEVKSLASDTRRLFGVYPNVPIANDIKLLLENQGIMLCEYPFPDFAVGIVQAGVVYAFDVDEGGVWRGVSQSFADDGHVGVGVVCQAGPAVSGYVRGEVMTDACLLSQFFQYLIIVA